jgi:hypothetical protein
MDPQNAGTPPAGDPAQNPPAPAAGGQGNPPADPNDGDQPMSLEEARKLRRENAALRKRTKDFEDADEAARTAQLSELDKLKKQLADKDSEHGAYRQAMQERLLHQTIATEASKLGVIDPADAAKLLDWAELEFDENGVPTNTAKLLAALVKSKPYLVRGTTPLSSGGPTNPPRSQSSTNGGAWDEARYQQLVSTPGAYNTLSPADKAALHAWIQRRQ